LSLCVTTWNINAVRLRLGGCAVRLGRAAGNYSSHVYVEPSAGLRITCYRTNGSRRELLLGALASGRLHLVDRVNGDLRPAACSRC
jgi:hypothetical protein